MTMYMAKSNKEMASDFITVTCQLIPKSFSSSSEHMHDLVQSPLDTIRKYYVITCGSEAEFYIRPLNMCIADSDLFVCPTYSLAFNDDFPVLPSDLSGLAHTIQCYEIKSYRGIPGFVRLRLFGKVQYNWKEKKYKLNRIINKEDVYLQLDIYGILNFCVDRINKLEPVICGPAIKNPSRPNSIYAHENDTVYCLFCPQWPNDAESWPFRPRNHGWPTSETISEVVRNGCHVVYVQHRACRGDIHQWRLSFSVAEVILLQSWTKTQQIVYHLLRFFAKRELIKKDCPKDDEVLCTYHLKTLMLWTCEEKPTEWWDSSPVISICCELLNVISDWLKSRHIPNYFIPEANLFHQPSRSTLLHQTEKRVNDIRNYGILCRWFVGNYIMPITQTQLKFLNTRKVTPHFMDYLLPLLEYRKLAMPQSVEWAVVRKLVKSNTSCSEIEPQSSGLLLKLKLEQSKGIIDSKCHKLMIYLPTTEKVMCFKYYDFLLHSLQFACSLSNGEISWNCSLLAEFVNAMSLQPKIIRSQFHNFPKTYTAESSRYQFMQAHGLLENLTGLNSRSEFQLLSLLSKEFLRRTLEADGYESNGVTTAASVYLAALHFASSEYQNAIRLCSIVLVDHHTPQEETETLNAGCLLFIDDVARIVGLSVLQKTIACIRSNVPCVSRHLHRDLRLSPEVFAHYLTVLHSERRSTRFDFGRGLPDSPFPMDNNVKALIKPKVSSRVKSCTQRNDARQIVYRRIDYLTETEALYIATNSLKMRNMVIDLLMEIALENMTSFYSLILKDFGMQCNIVDCYRVLYLYKCLQYDEVLQLCERILNEPDLQSNIKDFSFAKVSIIPPFNSCFDGDVQSLLGFHILFHYLTPLNGDQPKYGSTRECWFANYVQFQEIGLCGLTLGPYRIKYHYFLGRHFLARYLKARCCIDCNLSHNEVMTEFIAQKANLPFELIIRRFLLRRHRFIK